MAKKSKQTKSLSSEEKLAQALVPESEQPYKVPENWCWVELSILVDLFNGDRGTNYPSKKDYVNAGIPFINAGAIQGGRLDPSEFNYITREKFDLLRSGKILKNDILYCLRGSLGKTAIVDFTEEGAISSSLCILRVGQGILVKYLYYLMNSEVIERQQDQAENGSAQPNLSAASVLLYKTPLPPLPEQRRIVDRIESLFAKLDEAKEKAQAVVDGFEDRKAAILHKAFTGELTEEWRKEHGLDMNSWVSTTSSSLFEYVTSGSRGWAKYYNDEGAVFIRMGNLDHGTIELDLTDIQYVRLPDKTEGQRSLIRKGDILISITADVGMVGLVRDIDFEGYINQHVALARPVHKESAEFIAWYLVSDKGLTQFQKRQRGATKVGLGLDDIRNLSLSIPYKNEQNEILRILKQLISEETIAKDIAEQVIIEVDTMKKSILARAFRGELGTNDPADESAEELLKRIL